MVYQAQAGEGDCADQQSDPQEFWEELIFREVQGAMYIVQYAGRLCSLAQMGNRARAVHPVCFFLSQGQRHLDQDWHKLHKMWQFRPLVEASVFPFPSHTGLETFDPVSVFII